MSYVYTGVRGKVSNIQKQAYFLTTKANQPLTPFFKFTSVINTDNKLIFYLDLYNIKKNND